MFIEKLTAREVAVLLYARELAILNAKLIDKTLISVIDSAFDKIMHE